MPQQEQTDYWNGPAAERWLSQQESIDNAIGPFGVAALQRLFARPGERIVDVGCGAGATLLPLADAVGVTGQVLGVDPSEQLLRLARQRTSALSQVQLAQADASAHPMDAGSFDAVFSRFGVMFFEQPVSAFEHLRRALRPSGRLCFVAWQSLEDNPWVYEVAATIASVVADPLQIPGPRQAGPFAFAEASYVASVLAAAGFDEVLIEACELPVTVSTSGVEGAVEFAMRVGPGARLAADRSVPVLREVRKALAARFEPLLEGCCVQLPGRAWLVSAASSE